MALTFDESYYSGSSIGYGNYHDFNHFTLRANWLANFMSTNDYTHVTILGAGFGYVIKHLVETHKFTTANVLGIENSDYAISRANAIGYGVTQGYMIKADIKTHIYDSTDLVVSWNVLDCLVNLTEIQQAIKQINNIEAVAFIHVACFLEDPSVSKYNNLGYFLPSFFDVFSAIEMSVKDNDSFLVRYDNGYIYQITIQDGSKLGIPISGINIPTCGERVSN